jgi:hypothetical protein
LPFIDSSSELLAAGRREEFAHDLERERKKSERAAIARL